MNQVLVVREYDTITCNESLKDKQGMVYLEKKRFDELERFIREYSSESDESDILEFLRIGYKRGLGTTITFNSYVGIIELPSGFQIEILPKISFGKEDSLSETRKLFLKMLMSLREFEGKALNTASLNVDRMNLYELFISMFVQEVKELSSNLRIIYLAGKQVVPNSLLRLCPVYGKASRELRTVFSCALCED